MYVWLQLTQWSKTYSCTFGECVFQIFQFQPCQIGDAKGSFPSNADQCQQWGPDMFGDYIMDTNIAPILQQGHCCFFFLWKLINMLPSKSLPSYWSRRSQLFPLLQFTMCSISSLIKYFEFWTWCLRQWRFHTMLCRISKSFIENSVALHCIRRF